MWTLVWLLAVAPVGAQQPAKDPDVQKLVAAFEEAWAKGDAKGLAALHTENAVRVASDGVLVTGRAAIEQAFSKGFGAALKGTKLTITRGTESPLSADIQVGSGTWQVTGGAPPEGTPTKGTYVNTLVRQGGRWLIASSAAIGAQ